MNMKTKLMDMSVLLLMCFFFMKSVAQAKCADEHASLSVAKRRAERAEKDLMRAQDKVMEIKGTISNDQGELERFVMPVSMFPDDENLRAQELALMQEIARLTMALPIAENSVRARQDALAQANKKVDEARQKLYACLGPLLSPIPVTTSAPGMGADGGMGSGMSGPTGF